MNSDDEQIAKLKEVNRLLREALNTCRTLLAGGHQSVQETGQDNEPPGDARAK
jgi:hypothetical protein